MDTYAVAALDLTAEELAFTHRRLSAFRTELAGRLARVALRNRAAAVGGLAAGLLAGAAPLLLPLPAGILWPLEVLWLVGLMRLLSSHARLNGAVRAWRGEEQALRDELERLGGTVQALETRLKSLGLAGAAG